MFPEVSPPLLLLSSPPQILHPVVLPLTIAAYNLLSLLNIVPKIEVEKKIAHPHHHLRSATPLLPNLLPLSPSSHSADLFSHVDRYNDHKEHSSSSSSHQSSQTPSPSVVDLVSERRKAKALKVTSPNSLPALSHTPPLCLLNSLHDSCLMRRWLSCLKNRRVGMTRSSLIPSSSLCC
jgi:hypothetical protein